MLRLSAEPADGAHPYLTTPEHTHQARQILGPAAVLAPEQMVLLEDDPATALHRLESAPPVRRPPELPGEPRTPRLLRDDLHDGGSDRLVDALVVWGDEDGVARHVQANRDAGENRVCLQPLSMSRQPFPARKLRRLATALL